MTSISHGTLRPQDLLQAFANELERHDVGPRAIGNIAEARAWATLFDKDLVADHQQFAAQECLDTLIDALSDVAPAGTYFGAHEGDGSDFGFWPLEDVA